MKAKGLCILILLSISCSISGQTGFVCPEDCLKHDTGKKHPEKKERVEAITSKLKEEGIFSKLIIIEASPASVKWIGAVHSEKYISETEQSCNDGKKYLHTRDTVISKDSYIAACMAAGGVLCAVDAVMDGKVKNVFCAVRPPGHHASKDKAMGFCIFNNVAIGARYVQEKYKLAKVLIVDFDVHHGNGTQDIFKADPSVLYFSVHRSPFYPGTGNADEKGCGNIVNVPLAKASGDSEYVKVFEGTFLKGKIKHPEDSAALSARFIELIDDKTLSSEQKEEEVDKLGREIRTMGGQRDALIAKMHLTVKAIRFRLTEKLAENPGPQEAELLAKLWKDCGDILWAKHGHEGK